MTLDVTFGMALLAGIISFLSPCVLPLVPPYLCFITGASLEQLSESDGAMAAQRRRTLLAALFFVLGFSTVFILMGVSASYVGQLLRAWLPVLAQVAGVFIILMGLNFLGVFRLGFLSREKRYHAETRPAGLIGPSERLDRIAAWDRAARATPHGQPIDLSRSSPARGTPR